MEVPGSCMDMLDAFYSEIAKCLQGLPIQTCNIAATCLMGWMCIKSYIDQKRLIFLWRIMILHTKSIYKKVLIYRYVCHFYSDCPNHLGPMWKAMETSQKYGLKTHVQNAIESGDYMSMALWKTLVKKAIWKREQVKWKIMCGIFTSLFNIKKAIPAVQTWSWWIYTQDNPSDIYKVRILLKLLLNIKCFKKRSKVKNIPQSICQQCDKFVQQTVAHVLLECEKATGERDTLWNSVLHNCPIALVNELGQMTPEDRCLFLLSGMNNTYTREWKELYTSILIFIVSIYRIFMHYELE